MKSHVVIVARFTTQKKAEDYMTFRGRSSVSYLPGSYPWAVVHERGEWPDV